MMITLFGKVYGWAPVFQLDMHLKTGTVQRFLVYRFKVTEYGYTYAAPYSFSVPPESIAAWFSTAYKRKFVWGSPKSNWIV